MTVRLSRKKRKRLRTCDCYVGMAPHHLKVAILVNAHRVTCPLYTPPPPIHLRRYV